MLLDQLQLSYKNALLAKDADSKEALSSVIAAIKNKKIELQRDPTNDEMIHVLQKEIKLRREGASFLLPAGKQELYDQEMKKVAVLEMFLPAMLDADALQAAVQSLIDDGIISDLASQRGIAIKTIKELHGASVDGKLLNDIILEMIR